MPPPSSPSPLPPGRTGLPLLGETLAFARDGFGFVARRRAQYGPIFRTSLLGRRAVVLSGPDAVGEFIDPDKIVRAGSMPPHIEAIFGGPSLPLLDGAVHAARKRAVLAAFAPEALASYLPDVRRIVEDSAARWAGPGTFGWLAEMKRLALETICSCVGGITDAAELERIRLDYGTLSAAFQGLPIPLPGTRYSRALAARDRIFTVFRRLVRSRRDGPTGDGLSRMLAAGPELDEAAAVLELHHAVMAGFIVFAEFATSVIELTRHPEHAARLREEIAAQAPSGPVSPERLRAMPHLMRVVMETKRLTPIIPAVFGIARRDFTFRGVTVPGGWMVMWDVLGTNTDTAVYSDADRFDPDRFGPGREEHRRHEHAFVPQGGGPPTGHRCAGVDFSTVLMSVFLIVLLRAYRWELPEQDLEYDWRKTPPEPKDGLRAVVTGRA